MSQDKIQEFLRELPDMREDLPFSPEVLQRLFLQTGNGSMASMEDVGDTIGLDQGLTIRLLSLANSAYYGLQAQVESVTRAAAILGMVEIRNIVLALCVQGLVERYSLSPDFKLNDYWAHQILVGMLARELSRMTDLGVPGTMFTAGLLHDMGKLVIALKRPADWQAINDLAEADSLTDNDAEDQYWGMDHAVLGALVLKGWDLPADLVEPINWHHSPALAPEHSLEANILCLADCAVHAVEDPEGEFMARAEELCPDVEVDMEDVMETAEELSESDEIEYFVRSLI